MPDLTFLNPGEAFHLLDVRQLFARLDQLFAVVLPSCLLLLYAQKRFAGGRVALRTGYLGLSFILLLLVLMLAGDLCRCSSCCTPCCSRRIPGCFRMIAS
ncbi:MAG: hypothetical protein HZT40_23135 [Candidatus Thiothrix singaporensis]|uniref:Uncharacterized protein n=1 Tax=Candidatus Thiothrix singaporensis TaxID=2799669 RepID=A0A7L6AYP1_9GAMM|nr:MAG: hypothetical protein HZT40_23135 [Candidatus Thiothrix singaporensis]